MPQLTDFLPTTKKEMQLLGWEEADVILFSGDAYVDHPSFGAAVIGRRRLCRPPFLWGGCYRASAAEQGLSCGHCSTTRLAR